MARIPSNALTRLLLAAHGALAALTVDVEDADSVKAAAALVAEDLMSFYDGDEPGNTIGLLPMPPAGDYYWWTGGALWGGLLDYRNRTGETKYDDTISQSLLWQVGPNDDFLSPNWTTSIGNDDQAIWALSALSAEEIGFQEPGPDEPQWLTLAKNVFDEQSSGDRRVKDGECEGALRWQIFTFNNGYNYVNSASNIGYFNLAAQLAYLTGNETYLSAAGDTWSVLTDIGFVAENFDVYDGASAEDCAKVNNAQFSYTAAMLLQGSAYLYNHTGGDQGWKTRIDGLVDSVLSTFFPDGVAFEIACERIKSCTTDMHFFKGLTHKYLASTMQLAPYTAAKLLPVLKSSAKAAAAQCTGGDNGRMCGFQWSSGKFDGTTGAAQQLSVLSALASIMPAQGTVASTAPSNSTGSGSGSGSGNGSGSGSDSESAQNSTSGDQPAGNNMGAQASVSLGALVGSLLLGSLLM
ncbi:glycoside hydrolase family 76 protein [Hypoxylon crocopeplum]|nr:glycoside hydrolase family 76 protein [Hypoxylon crocopeplum]